MDEVKKEEENKRCPFCEREIKEAKELNRYGLCESEIRIYKQAENNMLGVNLS